MLTSLNGRIPLVVDGGPTAAGIESTIVAVENGALRLLISGDVGPDYTIEISTDLTNWQALSTTNPPAVPFFWLDRNASNSPMRFYRLLLGP